VGEKEESQILKARKDDNRIDMQTLRDHIGGVLQYMEEFLGSYGIAAICELVACFHDMGKASRRWQSYLVSGREKVPHAKEGALFLLKDLGNEENTFTRLGLAIAATVIWGHHSGLRDIIAPDGHTCLLDDTLEESSEDCSRFFDECVSFQRYHELKDKLGKETETLFTQKLSLCKICNGCQKDTQDSIQFVLGMYTKLLGSCLVDADRLDAARWESGTNWSKVHQVSFSWNELKGNLDSYLLALQSNSPINRLRTEINHVCELAGAWDKGVYILRIPTGGGKTLASLQFALSHAQQHQMQRIVFVIPYTSIIEQNASVTRTALNRSDIVLENHSGVLKNDDDSSDSQLYAERWDCPVVFTTVVQFFEALFSGTNTSLRRMHMLTNSVIVFDEIQALPPKLMALFSLAVRYLRYVMGCTIVLSSATQIPPELFPFGLGPVRELYPGYDDLYSQLHRTIVRIVDQPQRFTLKDLAAFVLKQLDHVQNVLVILNTKTTVLQLYKMLSACMPDIELFHLSTSMCAQHRSEIIQEIKDKLGKKPLICVSTNLVEAGVDLSFACVIRSCAGLDSVAQAAGRCNRNAECSSRDVYLVNVDEGPMKNLDMVVKGQIATRRVLSMFQDDPQQFDSDLLSPKAINKYFEFYYYEIKGELYYPIKRNEKIPAAINLVELLGNNGSAREYYQSEHKSDKQLKKQILAPSFATAGRLFCVINNDTQGVVIPFKESGKLLKDLKEARFYEDKVKILTQLQRYTVNVFQYQLQHLLEIGAIEELDIFGGIYELSEKWYSSQIGIDFGREASVEDYML